MRALRVVAAGLLVAFVDLRIGDVDLTPDPVGWAVVGLSLLRLRRLHPALVTAAVAALGAALLSLPALVGPDGPLLGLVVGTVETVVVFATCTAIGALLPTSGIARVALVLRWLDLALLAALALLTVSSATDGSVGGVLVPVAFTLVLVTLMDFVIFIGVLLLAAGREPETAD